MIRSAVSRVCQYITFSGPNGYARPSCFSLMTARKEAAFRSALHQLDAHAVGRCDIAQQAPANPFFQLDREAHAFCPQLVAEGCEVTPVHEAKMVDPPRVVAGKVGEFADRPGGDRRLARALPANENRYAAEINKDLRRAPCHCIGGDRGPEHLGVPVRRCFWILADDVNMVEFEGRIADHLFLVCEIGQVDRLAGCASPLR